jgi:hypothetical protein
LRRLRSRTLVDFKSFWHPLAKQHVLGNVQPDNSSGCAPQF